MVDVDKQAWNVLEEPPLGDSHKMLPMEGTFRLIHQDNYDEYLKSIGVSPLIISMVQKSDEMVTIYKDIDKQWKIMSENSIKAKSIRGYSTRNYKLVSNKFVLGEPKPEVLEDWDQRLVVSTVTLEEDNTVLKISQKAEKDLKYHKDSVIKWVGKGDILTMICETEDNVIATKTFVRHKHQSHEDRGPRRCSVPFF